MQSKPFLLILVSRSHVDPNQLVHGLCACILLPAVGLPLHKSCYSILVRPRISFCSQPLAGPSNLPRRLPVQPLGCVRSSHALQPEISNLAKHRACLQPLSSRIVLVGNTASNVQLEESAVM